MAMRLMICGSMAFARQMVTAQKKVEEMGHTVTVPHDTKAHIDDEALVDDLDRNLVHAAERDLMMQSFRLVASSDAILVLNYKRKGIEGYIGTSTLMEIGLAYYLGKKIYLLNAIPSHDEVRWAHEIRLINPTILHGDFSLLR